MPKYGSSAYKDVNFVFVLRNIGDDKILRGARNNDSPFFTTEYYATRRCKQINDKLKKEYSNCTFDMLYKVTKYELNRLYDISVEDDTKANRVEREIKKKEERWC